MHLYLVFICHHMPFSLFSCCRAVFKIHIADVLYVCVALSLFVDIEQGLSSYLFSLSKIGLNKIIKLINKIKCKILSVCVI